MKQPIFEKTVFETVYMKIAFLNVFFYKDSDTGKYFYSQVYHLITVTVSAPVYTPIRSVSEYR